MTTILDEFERVSPETDNLLSGLYSQFDEPTRILLTDIDRTEEVLTEEDFLLYNRISDEIDLNIEKDDTLISVLQDLLRTNKDSFKRLDNYVYANLKYEEHLGDAPNLIDKYRYYQRLFDTAFKRHKREGQDRQMDILIGGRKQKQKRKYRSKKRKTNKRKRKYRSKKRKI